MQDGWKTYLLFFAVSKTIDESGHLRDLGVAVLDCQHCMASKFGYPNDEGLPEHPYYFCGMSNLATSVLEVVDSPWAQEVTEQRLASARRIWGGRGMDWSWARGDQLRHFILTLKEKTFECLASSVVVECFCETFEAAYAHVIEEFSKH